MGLVWDLHTQTFQAVLFKIGFLFFLSLFLAVLFDCHMFLDLHSSDVYKGTTAADVYSSVMVWTLIYSE